MAADGRLELANVALKRVGEGPLDSWAECSATGEAVRGLWDACRRRVLRSFGWDFASSRLALTETDDGVYALPDDLVKLVAVETDYGWRLRGGYLLTVESSPLYVTYVRDEEDITLWPADCADALVWLVAEELAMALTKEPRLAQMCAERYQMALAEAKGATVRERRRAVESTLLETAQNPY